MKVGAVYCVYDDSEYLATSVACIAPVMDHILFLVSEVPWNGQPVDISHTLETIHVLLEQYPNSQLIRGSWSNEMDQRNFGLEILLKMDIDRCLVIDADEMYWEDEVLKLLLVTERLPEYRAFHIEWNTYWKKDYYRIEPREPYRPLVLVDTRHFLFTAIREGITAVTRDVNGAVSLDSGDTGYRAALIPPEICLCYHLSYCRDDQMMRRKIESNSHAHQFRSHWYEEVWLRWTPTMKNLHPIRAEWYEQAVPESISAFPPAFQQFIEREQSAKQHQGPVTAGRALRIL